MQGFDPKFRDLPDFIIGITKEIWEERGVETLNHYYTPNIPVRSPDGVVIGNQAVIEATWATLAEFPDRQLFGEDVIWSGNDEDGYLSSHRILSTATHAGNGAFGAATGTRLRYRIIADCAAINNQIYDEWLVRDLGAIVRQLGIDPRTFAANQIEAEGGPEAAKQPLTPQNDVAPMYLGSGNTHEVGSTYAEILSELMGAMTDVVEQRYDRAVQLDLPGGVTEHGWDEAARFWGDLRASMPDATFEIHHQIGRADAGMAPRAALRWSLTGSHTGAGTFGPPTGAPVHVMGISHAEFGPRGLHREFVLFDEVAIHKQILLHIG
ncbi:MAG: ester cyclase [Acidimicrobiaceae bacterium]|nr:ester cyclase [Acidimicrobiaceae bacterium]MXW74933.1 ester cyclase [Acidimicrobiaceae bacterium]MYD06629.1 ester cyclase [Acidimicrobiaceae bacterium]MYI57545.1 ester cyclase [Acidimicrobiaceae bacterium]